MRDHCRECAMGGADRAGLASSAVEARVNSLTTSADVRRVDVLDGLAFDPFSGDQIAVHGHDSAPL